MALRHYDSARPAAHDLWDRRSSYRTALDCSRSVGARHLDCPHAAAELITALGGFGGLAATITGIATLVAARRTADQLEPNHGSSVKDQLDRIERSLDDHGNQLDHQSSQLLQITRRVDSIDDHAHDSHSEMRKRIASLEAERSRSRFDDTP